MMALGQVKQPMKLVHSSPRRVPGAVPAKGSVQPKPNIDTTSPAGGTASRSVEPGAAAAFRDTGPVQGERSSGTRRGTRLAGQPGPERQGGPVEREPRVAHPPRQDSVPRHRFRGPAEDRMRAQNQLRVQVPVLFRIGRVADRRRKPFRGPFHEPQVPPDVPRRGAVEPVREIPDEIVQVAARILEQLGDQPELEVAKVGHDRVIDLDEDPLDAVDVTYHDPCHLKKSLGISTEPRMLINANPRYRLKEMPDSDWCCGLGGSFNLQYYKISSNIGKRKLDNIKASGCSVVATGCPACLLQIADTLSKSKTGVAVKHPIEIYAESLNGK